MGAILVRVLNARRQPLDDVMDIYVISTQTNATVAVVSDVRGHANVRIEKLADRQAHLIQVFPLRHRPVAQYVVAGSDDEPTRVELHTPLHPERVRSATFPAYDDLHQDLREVLERSEVEGVSGRGESLYSTLTDVEKAGLLNLFSKMRAFTLDDRRTIWSQVERLFRVRADRIFVDVQPALCDLVRSTVAADRFREVSGSLHTPPDGYCAAGSFKTSEEYGNLQLTFFASLEPPVRYKVDADIDDAAGLGHAFQVIRNWVTHGTTHPYDIHQILSFRQDVTLPYDLA